MNIGITNGGGSINIIYTAITKILSRCKNPTIKKILIKKAITTRIIV
ncbi:MAG: hypothetical protein ACJAX4_003751 [Clostridium sp.]|jgi:hypothetical protein